MSFLIEKLLHSSTWPAKIIYALYLVIIVAILIIGLYAIVK